jgi:hypothetical protein
MIKDKKLLVVSIFIIAMAYLESAIVVYLRGLYGIEVLLTDINLTPDKYTFIEIGREAATIVMLVTLALITGSSKAKKWGYFFLSFGLWDIFYYIWLYILIQWPQSLLEWDILFLIPLPWWGPVLTPVLISLLLIAIGYLLINEIKFKITVLDWSIILLSIVVILFTFVEDSINVILTGVGDITQIKPIKFNWTLYLIAFSSWVFISIKVFYTGLMKK